MREIEIICKRLRYEVHPSRMVFANVLESNGTITKVPVPMFDKNPQGVWIFNGNGKGYSSYTLRESDDWHYTGPTDVTPEMKRRSPGIDTRYGDSTKTYVTLEDALMAFWHDVKAEIIGGEFAIVATPKNIEAVRTVVEHGWPLTRVENKHLLGSNEVKAEEPESEESEGEVVSTDGKTRGRPKKARDLVADAKEATKQMLTV